MVMEMLDASEHRDDGSDRYCWLARLPGVPVSALRKDLVMERPLGHIVQLQATWLWLD